MTERDESQAAQGPALAQPAERRRSRSSRRRGGHRSGAHHSLARTWSEWRVEILVASMVAVAIFLLVERIQIRQTLLGWPRQVIQLLGPTLSGLGRGLVILIRGTTLSNLTAYVLLLTALVFVLWRVRWRLMTASRFTTRACPHCGGRLQRIHRRARDRLLCRFVPVRRYRCADRDCGWSGLRVGNGHPE
jgi:predicted RNA-binding Zn-ribbon protein involved in translation (DUF1610 family)